jgi:outer membrane protein TolC
MGTALELMQAETARVQARRNLINAHIALRVARTQLDHAVGRDVPAQAR